MSRLLFDPQGIPVDSVAGEQSVIDARLNGIWLRQRFAAPEDWTQELNDERSVLSPARAPIPASVLLPIVERSHGLTMLLTQRSPNLTNHPGQIAFPGGRADAGDHSAIDTALRETEEEIGLLRRHIDVIGTLPDYFTLTGYQITPVVALIRPPFDLRAEPGEVEEIFEVPLAFLMDGMHHQRRALELPNGAGHRTFYAMPYERFFIWGATAGILRNLFHFLRA
ncbi:MAG: 8-oxo-dGTP pyrophosphatase MutT (NUDIX family) [Bradyrhizobium sp.]